MVKRKVGALEKVDADLYCRTDSKDHIPTHVNQGQICSTKSGGIPRMTNFSTLWHCL